MWSEGGDSTAVSSPGGAPNGFKVGVYARFKPVPEKPTASVAGESGTEAENNGHVDDEEKEVTLPLHQRLALIKLSRGLKTNRQALKILMQEGSWFGKKWDAVREERTKAGEGGDDGGPEKPPLPQSTAPKEKLVASVQSIDPTMGRCVMVAPACGLREFSFDGVMKPETQQDHVYNEVCRKLVVDFLNGFNACVMGYGQTGSGKTYTLFGPGGMGDRLSTRGLVPRACEEVLEAIAQRQTRGVESDMACSYVEIYGDTISDLLKNGARCGQNKVSAQRFVLDGAAETPLQTMEDVSRVLVRGDAQKKRAATAMNDRSSRAHAIFILRLRQRNIHTGAESCARLFMADLGGCEDVKKSGVQGSDKRERERRAREKRLHRLTSEENGEGTENSENMPNVRVSNQDRQGDGEGTGREEQVGLGPIGFVMGERLREAVYINLGLLSLKKCIERLNEKSPYVPFQDSKLTMLLSEGLASSKTSVVVCGSMESKHAAETMAALRFGEKCALVETEARNKASLMASVLRALNAEIRILEEEIKRKERWEQREEKRIDTLAEEGTFEAIGAGGVEVRKVSVLTGAERERHTLEGLLRKRAELTGSTADMIDDNVEAALSTKGPAAAKKRVVGFGGRMAEAYGLGIAYQADADDSSRFKEAADDEAIPEVVKAKGAKQWSVQKEDAEALARHAKKVKRNRLVYSGMSYT